MKTIMIITALILVAIGIAYIQTEDHGASTQAEFDYRYQN